MAQDAHSESMHRHPAAAWQVARLTWLQVRKPRSSGPQGSLHIVYVPAAGQLPLSTSPDGHRVAPVLPPEPASPRDPSPSSLTLHDTDNADNADTADTAISNRKARPSKFRMTLPPARIAQLRGMVSIAPTAKDTAQGRPTFANQTSFLHAVGLTATRPDIFRAQAVGEAHPPR
jgi:hypothetical protein